VRGELGILAEDVLQRRLANRWEGAKLRCRKGLLFRLIAHLMLTLARLTGPGGVRAVAAESLAVKHQLLIVKRSRPRGPNLTGWDRLILGFCTLLVSTETLGQDRSDPQDLDASAASPSFGEEQASASIRRQAALSPGPKGPSRELIDAVVDMKRSNPSFGCRKIAERIASDSASRSFK
jgi:hypothetical protein